MRQCWTLLAVVLLACGGKQDTDSGNDAAISADAGDSAADSSLVDDSAIADAPAGFDVPVLPDVVIVDEGTECGPPPTVPVRGHASCCNGAPCAGDCIETAAGVHECQCFGIVGGCGTTLVCCQAGASGCFDRLGCER